jgi:predicted nucleic acid-binding protein
MRRTYLDSSVVIQAVQGVDDDKTGTLLEDREREFVAASILKLELLPQPTFHKRKAELAFLEDFFARVVDWCQASEELVSAALAEARAVPLSAADAIHVAAAKRLKADELITAERPGKPLHKARGLKVCFLPNAL